jgi:hypothetical protein
MKNNEHTFEFGNIEFGFISTDKKGYKIAESINYIFF